MNNFNFKLYSKIISSSGLIIAIILIGICGYMFIEGWTMFESFYMTVITVTTVGFGEVGELSQAGRLFTIVLIFLSLVTIAYAVTSISSYIFGGEYRKTRNQLKQHNKIAAMKNHVIICGFGRVGKQIAEDFIKSGQTFVVIERKKESVTDFLDLEKYNFVFGDATEDVNLHKANVESARTVITCMPSDADNLYVVLAAKELNDGVQIIARASKIQTLNKLNFAGADNVIMPDSVGGSHMASLVVRPDIMEFIDEIRIADDETPNVVSISYEDLSEEFQDKPISILNNRYSTGCLIIGLKDHEGRYMINPSLDTVITEGCKLLVLGDKEQVNALSKIFDIK